MIVWLELCQQVFEGLIRKILKLDWNEVNDVFFFSNYVFKLNVEYFVALMIRANQVSTQIRLFQPFSSLFLNAGCLF